MDTLQKIAMVKELRFLDQDEDDIDRIVLLLNEIAEEGDNTVIPSLCAVFDDEIFEPALLSDISETIFTIAAREGAKEGLLEVMFCFDVMEAEAVKCRERLYRSLMDSDVLHEPFIQAFKAADPVTQVKVSGLLHAIASKQSGPRLEKHQVLLKRVIT